MPAPACARRRWPGLRWTWAALTQRDDDFIRIVTQQDEHASWLEKQNQFRKQAACRRAARPTAKKALGESTSWLRMPEDRPEVSGGFPPLPGDDAASFRDGHYFLARSSAVGTNQLLGVIDADIPGVGVKADQSVFTSTKNIAGRNAHSVAADPVFNQVYVPIPAGNSTVCSGAGGGATSDANGCIAVFTTPNDDPSTRRQEAREDRGNR